MMIFFHSLISWSEQSYRASDNYKNYLTHLKTLPTPKILKKVATDFPVITNQYLFIPKKPQITGVNEICNTEALCTDPPYPVFQV